jgi:hypothetical protein
VLLVLLRRPDANKKGTLMTKRSAMFSKEKEECDCTYYRQAERHMSFISPCLILLIQEVRGP